MFLLGHIRVNKTVCSLDGTEAHIHLHYVHKHCGYNIFVTSYTVGNFYNWGQSENI